MCQKTCDFVKIPAKYSWLLNRQRRILNFDVVSQMTTYFLSHLSIPFWLLCTKNPKILNQFTSPAKPTLAAIFVCLVKTRESGPTCAQYFSNPVRNAWWFLPPRVLFFVLDMTGVRRKKAQRKRRVNTTKVGSKRKKKDKKVKVLK